MVWKLTRKHLSSGSIVVGVQLGTCASLCSTLYCPGAVQHGLVLGHWIVCVPTSSIHCIRALLPPGVPSTGPNIFLQRFWPAPPIFTPPTSNTTSTSELFSLWGLGKESHFIQSLLFHTPQVSQLLIMAMSLRVWPL